MSSGRLGTLKPNEKLKLALYMSDKYQYQVAVEAGIWPNELSAIKSGKRIPSSDLKQRIAAVLGLPVEELFSDDQ